MYVVSGLHVHLCTTYIKTPAETKSEHYIPWNWSYRYTIYVIGNKPRSSRRAAGAGNHRAISPIPHRWIWNRNLWFKTRKTTESHLLQCFLQNTCGLLPVNRTLILSVTHTISWAPGPPRESSSFYSFTWSFNWSCEVRSYTFALRKYIWGVLFTTGHYVVTKGNPNPS